LSPELQATYNGDSIKSSPVFHQLSKLSLYNQLPTHHKPLQNPYFKMRSPWSQAGSNELRLALEKQKGRKLRIPLPDPSRIKDLPTKERAQAERVVWTNVSSGYQPEMPRRWFAALYTFDAEAKVDRVFTNSVFWVVTRTNDCFY
jgi:hypothetical protein